MPSPAESAASRSVTRRAIDGGLPGNCTRTVTMPGVTPARICACQPCAVAVTSRTVAACAGSIVIAGALVEGSSIVSVALS